MTWFNPTIILNRLRVEKDGLPAYDELYHAGVNIVSGQNSSGKSTILNFIFYALGGDLSDWSETASLCTRVYAEVILNGQVATLSREISSRNGEPMEVFGGDMTTALNSARQEWLKFPYSRSSKESFSQMMFRLLDMPEAAGEASGKLTMHQVLRLLYADQLSPTENLFKYDGRWDTPVIRDAVGRLLCGAQETSIYENELLIRELSKEFDGLEAEQKAIYQAFGQSGESLTEEWVELQKSELRRELIELRGKASAVEMLQLVGSPDKPTRAAQDRAYAEVEASLWELNALKKDQSALSLSVSDLRRYAASLKNKTNALLESKLVSETLGEVSFESCPVCFEAILDAGEHACHLCKTPLAEERSRSKIVSFINEAALQHRQALEVLTRREAELTSIEAKLQQALGRWERSSSALAQIQSRPTSETQDTLRQLNTQMGYVERQLEDQDRSASVVQRLKRLSNRKGEISKSLTSLKDKNLALAASQEEKLAVAYTSISEHIKKLLRGDLRRQDSFADPKIVSFDFAANRITVDHHSYFSASSRVVLKTSFFVGFLAAALDNAFFRHPRFCLIDTMEDKGMEQERSQNFQRMIVDLSNAASVDHQIIFATAMIAPELNSSLYTVGKYSTLDDPTLSIG